MDFAQNTVILRDGDGWLLYQSPHRIIQTSNLDEIVLLLAEIEHLVEANSWHAAGFLAYEAAPAFDRSLAVRPATGLPLLWFGLYPAPRRLGRLPEPENGFTLGGWQPNITESEYFGAIEKVKAHIARGETYQVNYTFRLRNQLQGGAFALFHKMAQAQPVGYSAYVDTSQHILCSASPELFFTLDGETVTCRPMKGTVKRGRTLAEDEAQAAWLRGSLKNRAENVMIVDMIRNDLGRIAKIGSVRVPALFTTERYRTLWQMTSTVQAQTSAPFSELMTALFPCASITGAPKVRTMQIIAALETAPRGIYTGSIGRLWPGRKAVFNVAIRTVAIEKASGTAEYGIGGGIVWDSTPESEFDEALLKARALTAPPPAFQLLETLRWEPGKGYFLLEKHLKRLENSAQYFGYALDLDFSAQKLEQAARAFPPSAQRVRMLAAPDGATVIEHGPLADPSLPPLKVKLATRAIDSSDIFLYHKTTNRAVYEALARPMCDDTLLFNERGELTEFTIGSLVVEFDGQFYTPPVECGLLPGVMRADLLEKGQVSERIIKLEELPQCLRMFRVNSVRGWQEALLT